MGWERRGERRKCERTEAVKRNHSNGGEGI